MGTPIEFDRSRGGYGYTSLELSLLQVRLTEGELVAGYFTRLNDQV